MNSPTLGHPELNTFPCWVGYRAEPGPDGKLTKRPYNPRTGRLADPTDRSTWDQHPVAVAAVIKHRLTGTGFVFADEDPFTGVDLDHCRDSETGDIEVWAEDFIASLNSYTEISPSGTGVHIFVRGKLPRGARCSRKYARGKVEIYSRDRFFTVTGRHLAGTPLLIEQRQAELTSLHTAIFGQLVNGLNTNNSPATNSTLDDAELIDRIRNSKQSGKFIPLWAGDTSGYGGDNSSADLGLCNILAHWTGRDASRMDSLFRQSGLMRPKWDSRRGESTYGAQTIEKARAQTQEVYGLLYKNGNVLSERTAVPSESVPTSADRDSGPPVPEHDKKTNRLLAPVPTIGNTLLFQEHFAKNGGEKLYIFQEGAYRDHGLYAIRQTGKQLMEKWRVSQQWKKGLAEEVAEWITLSSPDLWERPPLDRINLRNGILDLETGKLKPHTPDWLSPIQLPIEYDASAEPSEWDKFLRAVLPSDVYEAEVTFQLAALLMLPYTAPQRALLLRGPRGTAKSRYLSGVRSFLGEQNTVSMSLHALEENRFSCQYLYGKLANICPDLPHRDLESTSKFKAITGEDFIDAEYKHGAQFHFKPFCRLLFSANQAPQSKDASDAFLDRWWVIPFEKRFQDSVNQIPAEELDRRLSDPKELSGVLNRALHWLPKVLSQKGITQTASMREAHDEFCAVTDPFRVWLAEYVTDDVDSVEPCNEVMSSYFSFLKERGAPPISSTAFGLEIRKQKRGITMAERTVWRQGRPSTPRCYIGVRLKRKEN